MSDVVTGFVVGGVLMGLFVVQRGSHWSKRAAQLTRAMQGRGDALQVYMLTAGSKIETTLTAVAQQEAERATRVTVEQYLASQFGLTQTRLAALQRLQARFS